MAGNAGAGSVPSRGGEIAETTASCPVANSVTCVGTEASSAVADSTGSAGRASALPERVAAVTWWPRRSASAATREPIMPVAPMSRIFRVVLRSWVSPDRATSGPAAS
nr:hypothetical protein [Lentzea aerocolonigenes]